MFPQDSGPSHERFWAVWQRHRTQLLSQSLRLMQGNRVDAEDALGAAMLRAFETFPRHAGHILNEKAWLSSVLHNICMDVHRLRRRHLDVPSSSEDEERVTEAQDADALSPEAALLRAEQVSHVRRHILALPPHLREPSVMRFLQGMSYEDIAARMGLTKCNARKRIQFACSQLRVVQGAVRDTGSIPYAA